MEYATFALLHQTSRTFGRRLAHRTLRWSRRRAGSLGAKARSIWFGLAWTHRFGRERRTTLTRRSRRTAEGRKGGPLGLALSLPGNISWTESGEQHQRGRRGRRGRRGGRGGSQRNRNRLDGGCRRRIIRHACHATRQAVPLIRCGCCGSCRSQSSAYLGVLCVKAFAEPRGRSRPCRQSFAPFASRRFTQAPASRSFESRLVSPHHPGRKLPTRVIGQSSG